MPFLPVNEASGSISLSQPGSNGMAVEAIAPRTDGQPGDQGYPLTQVP
jgi:hypothetical protein